MAFDDLELPHGTFPDTVGGSATYASLTGSTFAEVRVVGIVGHDFPKETIALLDSRGVKTQGIEHADGKTFRWAGRYAPDLSSRETLDTQLNVFATFQPKIPEAFKSTPIVLLGNIHPALQIDVLAQVERPKLVVADTMNFWIQGEPALLATMLTKANVLIINDEEARELSGIHNIRRAAAEIRRRGPHTLIIKRGEHGALLFDETGIFAVPGFPLEEVVDPTGAGDSFAGGFVGYLAAHADKMNDAAPPSGKTLRNAMLYGTATASFCVEGVGTSRLHALASVDIEARVTQIRALFEL